MIGKMLRVDLKRGTSLLKWMLAILSVCSLMVIGSWDEMGYIIEAEQWTWLGAIDLLENQMQFDTYKVVIVILLSGLYTGSICRDIRSRYQRQILYRVDLQTYVASRFLSNTIVIIVTFVISCYLFAGVIMLIGFPVITENAEGGLLGASYYTEWMIEVPYLYIGLIGLQFGMIVSAFSSIGLLFSAYQQDAFICIGVSAFAFFVVVSVSAFWLGNPFDVLTLMGMQPTLPTGRETPLYLSFAWGMLYPALVIALCSLKFYRKMKERVVNGII